MLSAGVTGGAAPAASSRPITLEECIQIALRHNLDIQAVRLGPELARYNLSLAYAGYEPAFFASGGRSGAGTPPYYNAETGFTRPGSESDTDSFSAGFRGVLPFRLEYTLSGGVQQQLGEQFLGTNVFSINQTIGRIGITLRQPLLKNFWMDDIRWRIQLQRQELKKSELIVREQILNTVALVENAYYDLCWARENVRVQEMALQWAQTRLAEFKKRVEVGTMAPLDEKEAESLAASTRADLLGAQRTLALQLNRLRGLLSSEYSEWHSVELVPEEKLLAVPAVINLTGSWMSGLWERPDLLRAREDLEAYGITLKYYKNQLYPQLDLVGSYNRLGFDDTGSYGSIFEDFRKDRGSDYSIRAELTIPLGNRAARNNLRSTKAQRDQALIRLKQLEQDIMIQIDDAVAVVRSSFERIDATRKAREYQEEALAAEEKKLANGKSTSFEVLRVQRDLTSARTAEILALAEYNKALIQLRLAEGSILDRHGIQLDLR